MRKGSPWGRRVGACKRPIRLQEETALAGQVIHMQEKETTILTLQRQPGKGSRSKMRLISWG